MPSAQAAVVWNWDSWNSLPADIQKIIDDKLPQLQSDYVADAKAAEDVAYQWCLSQGNEVIRLPEADLERFFELASEDALASAAALDDKGLPGTKMFERARKLISEKIKAAQ